MANGNGMDAAGMGALYWSGQNLTGTSLMMNILNNINATTNTVAQGFATMVGNNVQSIAYIFQTLTSAAGKALFAGKTAISTVNQAFEKPTLQ